MLEKSFLFLRTSFFNMFLLCCADPAQTDISFSGISVLCGKYFSSSASSSSENVSSVLSFHSFSEAVFLFTLSFLRLKGPFHVYTSSFNTCRSLVYTCRHAILLYRHVFFMSTILRLLRRPDSRQKYLKFFVRKAFTICCAQSILLTALSTCCGKLLTHSFFND